MMDSDWITQRRADGRLYASRKPGLEGQTRPERPQPLTLDTLFLAGLLAAFLMLIFW